jgi:hypothetical protein
MTAVLETMWMEAIVVLFKVLIKYLHGDLQAKIFNFLITKVSHPLCCSVHY